MFTHFSISFVSVSFDSPWFWELDTVAYVCFSLLCDGVYVFIQYGGFKGTFHL